MSDNQEEEEELETEEEDLVDEEDDLKRYLREMEHLEEDFSDLDDLDPEELQEMQDAINQVKESDFLREEALNSGLQEEEPIRTENNGSITEEKKLAMDMEGPTVGVKETTVLDDFSDIGKLTLEELRDMKLAIEEVNREGKEEATKDAAAGMVAEDLESKIMRELKAKKEKKKDSVMTFEKFLEYVLDKRDKIWYHALWYLVFESEDHVASKSLLYDVLKDVTSKSPIDPIPEHQFYFGLGYILRLMMNEKQVIRYISGGKFKININVNNLKKLLEDAGEPISTKPKIPEEEKQKMFSDFLKDDFSDI
ncbi:MAG: hypothetical protein ACFFAS_15685 [Promethearchaeota archaeon]